MSNARVRALSWRRRCIYHHLSHFMPSKPILADSLPAWGTLTTTLAARAKSTEVVERQIDGVKWPISLLDVVETSEVEHVIFYVECILPDSK
jgi:hypothetical protein